MALSVIPELMLTDLGLVDVNQFEIVDLFEPQEFALGICFRPAHCAANTVNHQPFTLTN